MTKLVRKERSLNGIAHRYEALCLIIQIDFQDDRLKRLCVSDENCYLVDF